ncbi:MAG: 3'-5' exonuclease, partial [Polyangia bacterium]
VSARLRDVKRIAFELLTDRARLDALRAEHVVEPAKAGELDELVKWSAAQLDEARPAELEGIDEDRLKPIDGLPLEDGSGEGGARARLDEEDDALLLRLYQIVHGELTRVDGEPLVYDHIALDEAQDLSASEVKLLYHATNERRSVTIAGDVAQRVIFDNAFRGWEALLGDVGVPAVAVRPLRLAYRSTAPVMRFARRVLGPLASTESTDIEARPGAEVTLHPFDGMGEAVAFIADALRSLVGREPAASVALLTRHPGQADAWWAALARAEVPQLRRVRRQDFAFAPGVDVTDVGQVKGLEFDYVILLDVNASSYPDTVESRHLLHIGATRATHQLWLVSTGTTSRLVEDAMRPEAEEGGAEAGATARDRSTSPAS